MQHQASEHEKILEEKECSPKWDETYKRFFVKHPSTKEYLLIYSAEISL